MSETNEIWSATLMGDQSVHIDVSKSEAWWVERDIWLVIRISGADYYKKVARDAMEETIAALEACVRRRNRANA